VECEKRGDSRYGGYDSQVLLMNRLASCEAKPMYRYFDEGKNYSSTGFSKMPRFGENGCKQLAATAL
jgi:hypothetical protein